MSEQLSLLVDQEMSNLLKKELSRKFKQVKKSFCATFSWETSKNCAVINLKMETLNTCIPYKYFKMESLHCLKFLPELNEILCKKTHNDTYFTILLRKQSSKYVRFKWSGNLYEFFYLCFGLGPARKVFNGLLNIPVSLLRRIMVRIFVYLDDVLLMGWTLQ